jgi:NDP-sugar pyrophosphorylase family protein
MLQRPRLAAVIAAGSNPTETDPLRDYADGQPKAMIPIAGQPMITYVIDSLAGSEYIQDIVVVGLPESNILDHDHHFAQLPDAGSIIDNYRAGMAYAIKRIPLLDAIVLCSCDVPAITSRIVDSFIRQCLQSDHDLYYSIVAQPVMEARFPGANRSYVHLRDGVFAGGDILLAKPGLILNNTELWSSLESSRKNVFRQARLLGISTLIKLITRRLSLAEIERRACDVLRIRGKVIPVAHAEVGMDVDKPGQLEIIRSHIQRPPSNS